MGIRYKRSFILSHAVNKINFGDNLTTDKVNLVQFKYDSGDPITVWASKDPIEISYNVTKILDGSVTVNRLFTEDPELTTGLLTASSTSTTGNIKTLTYDVSYGDLLQITAEPEDLTVALVGGFGFITKNNTNDSITIYALETDPNSRLQINFARLRKSVSQSGDITLTETIALYNTGSTNILLGGIAGTFVIDNSSMPYNVRPGMNMIEQSITNPKAIPSGDYLIGLIDNELNGYEGLIINEAD